jgi:multiple antibiotic resistance protein
MSWLSAAIILCLVMDPIGNVPPFAAVLSPFPAERQRRIIFREMVIALGVLLVFLFMGKRLLALLQMSDPALSIAGGIILFLTAIRMIFRTAANIFECEDGGEPFIVPLAIPLIAGPSAMATVILIASREPGRWLDWLLALLVAWFVSGVILMASPALSRLLGKRGTDAVQRLMGLLLTGIAVQMFLAGVKEFVGALR